MSLNERRDDDSRGFLPDHELDEGIDTGRLRDDQPSLYIDPNRSAFRKRRFSIILDMIKRIIAVRSKCDILDLGGEYAYWDPFLPLLSDLPLRLILLNVSADNPSLPDDRFSCHQGDATELQSWPDGRFDFVHSNSVIEHVGRWNNMVAMANNIRRLADSYYVQTPYYWFPMEPHYRTFCYHWIPPQWRVKLHTRRRLGFFPIASNVDQAMKFVEDSYLLDWNQFRALFPDAELRSERFFGITKSMIATRLGL